MMNDAKCGPLVHGSLLLVIHDFEFVIRHS